MTEVKPPKKNSSLPKTDSEIYQEPMFVFEDLEKKYKKNNTNTKAYIKDLKSKYIVDSSSKSGKHFVLLIGKPGAGKSYFIENHLKENVGLDKSNFINLNPDDLRYYNQDFINDISGIYFKKPNDNSGTNYTLNGKNFIFYPNEKGFVVANKNATINTLDYVRNSMQNFVLPYFLNKNNNIIYDSACNDAVFCGNLLRQFSDSGYKIYMICVDVDNNTAFQRAKMRQEKDGRYMSDEYLKDIYKSFDIKRKKEEIIIESTVPVDNITVINFNNINLAPQTDSKKKSKDKKQPRTPGGSTGGAETPRGTVEATGTGTEEAAQGQAGQAGQATPPPAVPAGQTEQGAQVPAGQEAPPPLTVPAVPAAETEQATQPPADITGAEDPKKNAEEKKEKLENLKKNKSIDKSYSINTDINSGKVIGLDNKDSNEEDFDITEDESLGKTLTYYNIFLNNSKYVDIIKPLNSVFKQATLTKINNDNITHLLSVKITAEDNNQDSIIEKFPNSDDTDVYVLLMINNKIVFNHIYSVANTNNNTQKHKMQLKYLKYILYLGNIHNENIDWEKTSSENKKFDKNFTYKYIIYIYSDFDSINSLIKSKYLQRKNKEEINNLFDKQTLYCLYNIDFITFTEDMFQNILDNITSDETEATKNRGFFSRLNPLKRGGGNNEIVELNNSGEEGKIGGNKVAKKKIKNKLPKKSKKADDIYENI